VSTLERRVVVDQRDLIQEDHDRKVLNNRKAGRFGARARPGAFVSGGGFSAYCVAAAGGRQAAVDVTVGRAGCKDALPLVLP
jgi:hypothetical protein